MDFLVRVLNLLGSFGGSTSKQDADEEQEKLNGIVELDKLIVATETAAFTREQLKHWVEESNHSQKESDAIFATFDAARAGSSDSELTLEQWKAYLISIEEQDGNQRSRCGRMIAKFDTFSVGAWHEWDFTTYVSGVGGFFSLLVYFGIIVTVVTSAIAFAEDANTAIQQTRSANRYPVTDVPEFFLYVRTSSWQYTLDETLFSFRMTFYTKSLNSSNGKVIESYTPVLGDEVTSANFTWWPSSVPSSARAYAPLDKVSIRGAYHLDLFEQLEVKLAPCQNSTPPSTPLCKPPDVIRNALHGGSVNLVTQSPDIDYTSIVTEYWTIVYNETKQIDIWLAHKSVETSGKFSFAATDEQDFVQYEKSSYLVAPLWTWDGGSLLVWWFSQTTSKVLEERTRETVSVMLGEWGGTWATLLAVFGLFAYRYNERELQRNVERLKGQKEVALRLREARVSHDRFIAMYKAQMAKPRMSVFPPLPCQDARTKTDDGVAQQNAIMINDPVAREDDDYTVSPRTPLCAPYRSAPNHDCHKTNESHQTNDEVAQQSAIMIHDPVVREVDDDDYTVSPRAPPVCAPYRSPRDHVGSH